jgi:hypothetical protein
MAILCLQDGTGLLQILARSHGQSVEKLIDV